MMKEVLEFAFSGVNIIPSVLFIFVLCYWAIAALGLVSVDALDVDLDIDIDADAEISGFGQVLAFFNLDQIPLMVFVSFYAVPLWLSTLIINDLLGFHSFLPGLIVFVPAAIICLFVAKYLTLPIALLYKNIDDQTEAVKDIVGKICTAKLPITSERISQAEIRVKGTSVLINAKTRDGFEVPKGSTALVIEFDQNKNTYYVEPYQL